MEVESFEQVPEKRPVFLDLVEPDRHQETYYPGFSEYFDFWAREQLGLWTPENQDPRED
jgi:hypothetical protein